jgi:hypothetical protein
LGSHECAPIFTKQLWIANFGARRNERNSRVSVR